MSTFIIHHNDGDGYMSAAVAMFYLREIQNKISFSDIKCIEHDYHYDENKIEVQLEGLNSNDKIFMVDITLSDEFMIKYAKHIIWIDHHKSAIERINNNSEISNALFKNYSKINITREDKIDFHHEFFDNYNEDTIQIAACELVWLSLIGEDLPRCVSYAGRYDIWKHNDNDQILDFQEGFYTLIKEYPDSNDHLIKYLYDKLFKGTSDHYDFYIQKEINDFIKSIIKSGSEIRNFRKQLYRVEAPKYTSKCKIGEHTCLIINRGGINSKFFDSVKKVDIDVFITFQYSTANKVWKCSIYSNDISNGSLSAYQLLEYLRTVHEFKLSNGGHENACGFTDTDIQSALLNHIELI